MTGQLNRWATSVHESAHAVIGRRCGIAVDRATISADGRSGEVRWASNAWPEAAIIVALAGAAAQRRLNLAGDDGAYQDFEQARDVAARTWGFWSPLHLDRLQAICKAEVEAAWPDIERLAIALYRHGELTGAEIESILSNAPPTEAAGLGRHALNPFGAWRPSPNRRGHA